MTDKEERKASGRTALCVMLAAMFAVAAFAALSVTDNGSDNAAVGAADDYHTGDIAVINAMVDNNDLSWWKASSDGDVTDAVTWFTGVGVEGILPLERQAGVDVALFRQRHPKLLMVGAFDKMTMNKGEAVMRAEFERLLPVMRQGGFVPGCDHQTPPGVSYDQYQTYLKLLREYAVKAAT